MNNTANEIKEMVSPRDCAEHYGIQFNSKRFARCPFHNEKTASFTYKGNRFRCFGCGWNGSVIDFVMAYNGIDFHQAVIRIKSDFGIFVAETRQTPLERIENKRISKVFAEIEREKHENYLKVANYRRILYKMYLLGHKNLLELIEKLDIVLDDYTGEEARNWERAL